MVWLIAAMGFVSIVCVSKLLRPFREWVTARNKHLGEMIGCPQCFGFWTGLAAWLVGMRIPGYEAIPLWLAPIAYGATVSWLAWGQHVLLVRLGQTRVLATKTHRQIAELAAADFVLLGVAIHDYAVHLGRNGATETEMATLADLVEQRSAVGKALVDMGYEVQLNAGPVVASVQAEVEPDRDTLPSIPVEVVAVNTRGGQA